MATKCLLQRETGIAFKAGLTLVGHSSPDIARHSVLDWRVERAHSILQSPPGANLGTNVGLNNAE
jgi:hypothetical protein